MTTVATIQEARPLPAPRALGLSGRVILLMISFMMLAEFLVYIPAAASFRRSWLSDRLMGAQMIALALSATPDEALTPKLEKQLLAGIRGGQAIGVRGPGTRWLLAMGGDAAPIPNLELDLRNPPWYGATRGLFRSLFSPPAGLTRVIGPGPPDIPGVEWVELILDETPLRDALLSFTRSFLLVSLAVSAGVAALLYLTLHLVVIRPVRRLSANIAAFSERPEDAGRIISPSDRSDEIGVAERALARMEMTLASELRQKSHLADLGLAVSKINHELRNMLTTAQLLGDRLTALDEPTVKGVAPRLIRTLDRAIAFCTATLAYGRASELPPSRELVRLKPLVLEQLDLIDFVDGQPISVETDIPDDLRIDADPEQLGRVLLNLARNATEALRQANTPEPLIRVAAARRDGSVTITIFDNGPGVPDGIRTRLFSAFQASQRVGGTGLGLPVAEELVRLHGGTLVLKDGGSTTFVITIPDRRKT